MLRAACICCIPEFGSARMKSAQANSRLAIKKNWIDGVGSLVASDLIALLYELWNNRSSEGSIPAYSTSSVTLDRAIRACLTVGWNMLTCGSMTDQKLFPK